MISAQELSAAAVEERDDTEAAPYLTVDARDLLAKQYAPPRFLIEHLVPERSVVLVTADSGAGKTSLLLHAALSYAFTLPVAGRFGVFTNARPILYCNGEMETDTLVGLLHANAAGIGIDVSELRPGAIHFEGKDGFAEFYLPNNDASNARRFEALVDRIRPGIIVFDTFRALFEADENKAREVRTLFTWLRSLTRRYNTSVVVEHHVRKLSQVGNGARERVSGSRDLISASDVHIALKSQGGSPVHALLIDKTRTPFEGVASGTEWPIEARWVDGVPPRSIFVAGDATNADASASAREQEKSELIALLAAEGPKTRRDLGAKSGTRRRALDELLSAGEVVTVGKAGRADLLGLPGAKVEACARSFDDDE